MANLPYASGDEHCNTVSEELTLVTHTYDWTQLTDPERSPRAGHHCGPTRHAAGAAGCAGSARGPKLISTSPGRVFTPRRWAESPNGSWTRRAWSVPIRSRRDKEMPFGILRAGSEGHNSATSLGPVPAPRMRVGPAEVRTPWCRSGAVRSWWRCSSVSAFGAACRRRPSQRRRRATTRRYCRCDSGRHQWVAARDEVRK